MTQATTPDPAEIRAKVCDQGWQTILAHPLVGMPAFAKAENEQMRRKSPQQSHFGKHGNAQKIAEKKTKADDIRAVLTSEWQMTRTIAKATGFTHNYTGNTLREMQKRGEIEGMKLEGKNTKAWRLKA